MTTLLLLRHGATEWTQLRRLQGRTDIDLSADGRQAVRELAPVIEAWRPRTVICSPLSRTRSTAALLGARDVVVDERWAEAGLGQWEGLTPDVIGDDYLRWRGGVLVPPLGETPEAVTARTTAAVHDATAQPGPVLVVTHGGVIRAVLAQFIGLSTGRLVPVAAPSITALDVDPDGSARLRALNVAARPG
ncbi:histidine phosphatase family protein [Mycolicibacterium sp.]|uniref:histidine phosphatase family protein n=1 Tax=Mycolicibacterium sp. TaxID=2320850 RepID=UPI00355EECF4